MILTTPSCISVRKKLNSNQYVVQDLNTIQLNFGYTSNERFGAIDAFVISKEDYDKIVENVDKEALTKKISSGSPLIVISKEHLDLISPKIRYVPESNLLDEITELQVSTVEYNPVLKQADVIKVSNQQPAQQVNEINTSKIEKEEKVYREERQEEIKEMQQEQVKAQEHKKEQSTKVLSLNTVNMYDLVRIASLRDKSIARLQDSLEKLTVRLRTAEPTTVDKLVSNYLDIEDDFCYALYAQIKLIIDELVRLFNSDIQGKVDSIYDKVKEELIKNTYGLSYNEVNKLLDDREKLANELQNILLYIASNYSNLNEVISEFASNLKNFSFSTSPGFPVSADDELNDKRFDIYQKLIDMKAYSSSYEQELTDKIEHGLALIKTSFEIQDKLNRAVDNERLLKTQGAGVDVLINVGPTYTVLKLLVLKNKLLSMFDVTVIDLTGDFEDITKFDNNLTYMKEIPSQFDSIMNYIIVTNDQTLSADEYKNATNVYIPTKDDNRRLEWAKKASEYLKNTYNCKVATVITPCAKEHNDMPTAVCVDFIDLICNDNIYEECKYDRRILRLVSKMR